LILLFTLFDFACGLWISLFDEFLHPTAATAVAHLSNRSSVCQSVRLSVTRVDQSKTVQGRITKSSPSAA